MPLIGKLVGKLLDAAEKRGRGRSSRPETPHATPVTDSTPDEWNQVYKGRKASDTDAGLAKPKAKAPDGATHEVRFENLDLSVSVASGTNLLDAAMDAGTDLTHYCGGMCSCGSCRIEIVSGEVSEMDENEELTLELVLENPSDRLACQTQVLGNLVVRVPEETA